ncbi:armadillo-like helical domain containing protein 1 [Scleropages formosus]|uniref:armadillo-like helical domain containing protein 1 n=1 Tax=Scleropages formosus TaxID=113540 RepID=UPI0010FA8176|nr:armadillo-like helical domain containing protein 1 [Scleropages formosus]
MPVVPQLFPGVSMPGRKGEAAVREVQRFLRQWDRSGSAGRTRMLAAFVAQNAGSTGPELEQRLAHMASLLLARVHAWMRLHYTCGTCLGVQLRSVGVFLSAPSNHSYLTEFLEVGGVFTILDIINHKQTSDGDKREALHLLQAIANAGRTYKELICESLGLPVIAKCLGKSKVEETQEAAVTLLQSLAHGNPKHKNHIYMELISLLSCTSTKTQQLVLQTLCIVQKTLNSAHSSILEPLFNLLKSLSSEVQYEALQLIRMLKGYEVIPALLKGLVTLLKPKTERIQKNDMLEDPENITVTEEFPAFIQQAAAARAIRMLSQESQEMSDELLRQGVVHHLLCAMGNQNHADAQKQASLALEQFVRVYPVVKEHVRKAMGSTLFNLFVHNAEVLHMKMDEIQVDILLSNKVNISEVLKEPPH